MVKVRFKPLRIPKRRWRQPVPVNHDPEKSLLSTLYEDDDHSSSGSEYSQNSSRASSHSYNSADAILRPRKTRQSSVKAYELERRERRRCNRNFTLAIAGILALFLLFLVQSHKHSQRQVVQYKSSQEFRTKAWEEFSILQRYYGGLARLVDAAENVPEFPADTAELLEELNNNVSDDSEVDEQETESQDDTGHFVPKSFEWSELYPARSDSDSPVDSMLGASECFLDEAKSIRVPSLRAYNGTILGFPDQAIGDPGIYNQTNRVCFDRFGRLGPYGFGYSEERGGTGAGLDGDRAGARDVWADAREVDYSHVNWKDAQDRCQAQNPSQNRTAVLLRTWTGYNYDREDLLHLRALTTELALASRGLYDVHFLVQVKDDSMQAWSDDETYQRTLDEALPEEFRGMGTLWSERQMGLMYSGLDESLLDGLGIHSNERSAFMAVQHFARQHPEYAHFWNVELDVRYTAHFLALFEQASQWARMQPRKGLWERNARYFVPAEHGSWNDFTHLVRVETEQSQHSANLWHRLGIHAEDLSQHAGGTVWGPLVPDWDDTSDAVDIVPPTQYDHDKYTWGVGEDADLLTFSPIFDPELTGWAPASDVRGYTTNTSDIPRRASLGVTTRLSRTLLEQMHRDTSYRRRTMASEMWPATTALHHGLKAVYVPHPQYIERKWPTDYLAAILNSGPHRKTGGSRASVFAADRIHNLKGLSWSPNSEFAARLWRRWLGYKADGYGGEEFESVNGGRMCLPPMLLHPVKQTDLVYEHRPSS